MLMREFVQSFRRRKDLGGVVPVITSPEPLLDAICDEKKEDLESLIEELEALSSREYLGRQTFNSSPVGAGVSERERWPGMSQLSREAAGLLGELKRAVYLHYRTIADPAQTAILEKPLGLLRNEQRPAVVFTTNYDPAVEQFCVGHRLRLIDGFVHDEQRQEYAWSRDAFDQFFGSPDSHLVLFKLHGSTNWIRDGNRVVKSPASVYDVSDPEYKNVMIYPATNKVATKEPFFTAYDYLERCLDAATFCLVIGYSFRDYDTLMRFKSASLSNRKLRIAVLDPRAAEISKALKAQGIVAVPVPYALDGVQEPAYMEFVGKAKAAGASTAA